MIIAAVVTIVLFLILVMLYNKLVTLRNRFKNSYAQIDVQLKRRYDLIPNLVESVKGAMKHERETLEAVINARNTAFSASQAAAANPGDGQAMQTLMGAEAALTGTLGKLFALQESYPEIASNENALQLQEELTSTENRISFARQAFNDAVTLYNTSTETFPSVLIAGPFGFRNATLFAVKNAAEKEPVKVKF